MKRIAILNGPNLNLLGKREPEIYGVLTFEQYFEVLQRKFSGECELTFFQSNSEGLLIDKLHEWGFDWDGIIVNAGAYAHTSYALADALRAIPAPIVNVHISNTFGREQYRREDVLAPHCSGIIIGFGLSGYELAIKSLLK